MQPLQFSCSSDSHCRSVITAAAASQQPQEGLEELEAWQLKMVGVVVEQTALHEW